MDDEAYISMAIIAGGKRESSFIDAQINIREDLISECVGSLYPAILQGEIDKLEVMKTEFIREEEMEL
jgi:hypothetical protein